MRHAFVSSKVGTREWLRLPLFMRRRFQLLSILFCDPIHSLGIKHVTTPPYYAIFNELFKRFIVNSKQFLNDWWRTLTQSERISSKPTRPFRSKSSSFGETIANDTLTTTLDMSAHVDRFQTIKNKPHLG